MSTKFVHLSIFFLIAFVTQFVAVKGFAQDTLLIRKYDPELTPLYLTHSLADHYVSFNKDTCDFSILFLQNTNKKEIKSLRIEFNKGILELSLFPGDSNKIIRLDKKKFSEMVESLRKIDRCIEITEQTSQKLSEYYVFLIYKIGGKEYHLKASNYLFFHHNNEYIDYIKKFIKVIGLDYTKLIHEYIDG